ncbi:hypothetical protein [Geothrix sp. 21YS21S-2]|uniref:hypothetical protein n=1 Tax=Geothrix sp. 21YS21S-2 TaxID=3068893 RepID=UPI0027B93F80|nr:hypothetical protein [Geothrix sp. 21YS21S-2]
MWRRIITLLLRLMGKGHWSPFLRALSNQGRPSPVFFPPELIDQGLSFALTGITNTFGFQGHAGWALPWWAEQQLRRESPAFIPTGVNVLTVNLTNRNWTALALRGAPWKAMVDPCGMLTSKAFAPSWMPALAVGGRTWIPSRLETSQVAQELREGWQNRVVTRFKVEEGLDWSSEAMAFRHGGQDWVHWTHHLAWAGPGPPDLTFMLGLRPYNALTLGPVFRSRMKRRFWSVNRQAALMVDREPDAVHFGRDRTDPLLDATPPEPMTRGRSRHGWLGGAARWNVRLESGQAWDLSSFVLVHADDGRLRWGSLDTEGLQAAADAESQAWAGRATPLGFRVADPGIQTLVSTLTHRLPAFDNGSHFAPGAFFYNHHWLRDSAFLAFAHDLWGLHGAVADKERAWLKTQTWAGDFRSHSGEWDGSGETLFTWSTHVLMTGDGDFLARNWRKLERCARWIARTRRKDPDPAATGLLPAGLSAEHFGPNDHYLWDNFWSLAGLDRFRLALERWPAAPAAARRLAEWLATESAAYRDGLQVHIERLTLREAGLLPSSPYRHPDAACIGTLAALSPLDLDLGQAVWAKGNVDFLVENWARDGFFYQPIIHTGGNAYLTVQLARALQCLGDGRWLDLLAGVRAHATPTCTWPEASHPRTGGGCMGDGDHGWACAEVLSLIRLALVRDQGERILLLPNAPGTWWANGPLGLTDAPTPAGRLTFELKPTGPGAYELAWNLDRKGLRTGWPLVLVIPGSLRPDNGIETTESPWGTPALSLQDSGRLELH